MSLKEQLQKEIDKPLEDFLGKADADFQEVKDELAESCICHKCGDPVHCWSLHEKGEKHIESMCGNCAA